MTNVRTDVASAATRVEELLAGFGTDGEPGGPRERAEELVRTVAALYGEGLERMLTVLHERLGDGAGELFAHLCEDSLIQQLLCLHGLHPLSLEDRIAQALDSVMPYVTSHGGNIELSRIEGETAYVYLEGSCDGCPGSASTLKLAVESAILERAPEIREVRAEETTLRILARA